MAIKPVILLILFFVIYCSIVSAQVPAVIEWNRTYGGLGNDSGQSVKQTNDGGYIIAGILGSNYTTTEPATGSHETDLRLIKTDSNGNKIWNNTFNFSIVESTPSIEQTSDGGYIISVNGLTDIGSWQGSIKLLKIDSDGNRIWNTSLLVSGSFNSATAGVKQTSDGYFVVSNIDGSTQNIDIDIYKIDSDGNFQWNKTISSSTRISASSSIQTSDGGYVIVGGNAETGQHAPMEFSHVTAALLKFPSIHRTQNVLMQANRHLLHKNVKLHRILKIKIMNN